MTPAPERPDTVDGVTISLPFHLRSSEYQNGYAAGLAAPVTDAGLDVERLARAIILAHYGTSWDIQDWERDLDHGFEWYASARDMATDILAALSREKETA